MGLHPSPHSRALAALQRALQAVPRLSHAHPGPLTAWLVSEPTNEMAGGDARSPVSAEHCRPLPVGRPPTGSRGPSIRGCIMWTALPLCPCRQPHHLGMLYRPVRELGGQRCSETAALCRPKRLQHLPPGELLAGSACSKRDMLPSFLVSGTLPAECGGRWRATPPTPLDAQPALACCRLLLLTSARASQLRPLVRVAACQPLRRTAARCLGQAPSAPTFGPAPHTRQTPRKRFLTSTEACRLLRCTR